MLQGFLRLIRILLTEHLSIVVVAALGLTAIHLLLPRPRRYPPLYGALAGVAALLVGGGWLVRAGALTPESLLFYFFSAISIVAATLLITQRNPARAALAFALVVLSTCGLFLLLAAPFLMAATTIVYAGAIVVTFLFVLMLAQQEGLSNADQRSREPMLASIAGFLLLVVLLYALAVGYENPVLQARLQRLEGFIAEIKELPKEPAAPTNRMRRTVQELDSFLSAFREGERTDEKWKAPSAEMLGGKDLANSLYAAQDVLAGQQFSMENQGPIEWQPIETALLEVRKVGGEALQRQGMFQPREGTPLSTLSGPAPNEELRRDAQGRPELPAENVAYLGRALFTDYLITVELAGTLLLVAAIGAIAIAHRRAEGSS